MKLVSLIAGGILLFSANAHASSKTEIGHLLEFVATTDCQYERNGSFHSGMEAVEHIKKKYDYYVDDIKTAEDFIKYSATKSVMSGKYYLAHCANNAPIKSRDWLLNELKEYRANR